MTHEVGVQVDGRAAIITIDRPHARNAIGLGTISELEAALLEVSEAQVGVVVLIGAGDRAFVSGGDLKEFEALRTQPEAERMARRMRAILDRVARMPMPVIAALNGHAFGGGAEVAVAADIRVAADDIRIGFTQSALGIMPAWGGAERLTDLVGRSRALLLLCSGRTLTAKEAHEWRLIDQVLPRASFEAAWRELAATFAGLPSNATRSIKSVVASVSPGFHPETEDAAVQAFAELWAAPEHWEMAAAAAANRRQDRKPPKEGS